MFAEKHRVSLDYILLGLRGGIRLDGEVDPYLFMDIETAIDRTRESPQFQPVFNSIEELAYYSATIYNKIIRALKPGDDWAEVVNSEVSFFFNLKRTKDFAKERSEEIKTQRLMVEDETEGGQHPNSSGATSNAPQAIVYAANRLVQAEFHKGGPQKLGVKKKPRPQKNR